jgi:hypothetical protein
MLQPATIFGQVVAKEVGFMLVVASSQYKQRTVNTFWPGRNNSRIRREMAHT